MLKPKDEQAQLAALQHFFRRVEDTQYQFNSHLHKAVDHLHHIKPIEEGASLHLRYKVLQLRLDQQDLLSALMKLHHSLCLAIGLDPKNSEQHNLMRLHQLLGEENFKHEFSLLTSLVNQLSLVFNIREKQRIKASNSRQITKTPTDILPNQDTSEEDTYVNEVVLDSQPNDAHWLACEHELTCATELEACFRDSIEQLTEALQAYEGIPKFGLIYNYIAGLQGPVSQFHVAFQHGLGYINYLMQSLNFSPLKANLEQGLSKQPLQMMNLIQHLDDIYQRMINPQLAVQLMPAAPQPLEFLANNPTLSPQLEEKPQPVAIPTLTRSPEQLEQTNQLRRMLQFFPH